MFNSQKSLNNFANYIKNENEKGGSSSNANSDNKNVRFKDDQNSAPAPFRPVISDPIPNPSFNSKNLADLPDLRNLKQQLINNTAIPVPTNTREQNSYVPPNININQDSRNNSNKIGGPIYSIGSTSSNHYENPSNTNTNPTTSRNSSHRGASVAGSGGGGDNFENLYSKVNVRDQNRQNSSSTRNQYVPPPQSSSRNSRAPSTQNSSLRYEDDQPVYVNSNFDENEI
jgi:hypothetical protein